jgi:hypothetical protein
MGSIQVSAPHPWGMAPRFPSDGTRIKPHARATPTLMEAPAPEDARIAAIVAAGRATRRPVSRAAWLAAGIVGAICAIGFVLLLALDGAPATGSEGVAGGHVSARASSRGAGCAGGLGLGLGLGIAIGIAIARRQAADHSSRNRP